MSGSPTSSVHCFVGLESREEDDSIKIFYLELFHKASPPESFVGSFLAKKYET